MSKPLTDAEFMANTDVWPGLVLPIVRRGTRGLPECAFLTGDGPNIYFGNIWAPAEQLRNARKESFESYDAIVAAGWRVD